MAVYKVIQDIEADDKLLGPLSLRQFIYAGITVFCLYLSYFAISKGAAFLLIMFLPPAFISGFFAFPWGREQPTEIWALARVRFLVKPRKRIWNQTGVKELVTITAPKKVEKIYTDGLSQIEVKSRLQTLASTIDSRGWAIKSAAMSPYATTPVVAGTGDGDRLIDPGSLPQNVPTDNFSAYDDVLDPTNNPKAHQFDEMLEQNAQAQRQRLMSQMQQTAPPDNAVPQQSSYATQPEPVQNSLYNAPEPTGTTATNQGAYTDEQALVQQLRDQAEEQTMQYSHLPTILPLDEQRKQAAAIQEAQAQVSAATSDEPETTPVTPAPDAAILELAQKDDWNISTIARQAKKAHGEEPEEVVISLH